MQARCAADVLLVSLGSTEGLRRADAQLAGSLRKAGATVTVACPAPRAPTPTMMLTDLGWSWAARQAALRAAHARAGPAGAVIYSSTTAALLWPRPGAIRFDALAAANRPGRDGVWQRPLERRRLQQAPLLVPCSEGSLAEVPPPSVRPEGDVVVVPIAIDPWPAGDPPGERDIWAITYAANPLKKGLDRVLAAWRSLRAERGPECTGELVVAGTSDAELRRAGVGGPQQPGVRLVGALPADDYRALLRRARVFACAPRREDYGLAQLEALAEGCQLVTNEAPGPYAALPIARELDRRLVGDDLATGLRVALDDPRPDYGPRAREALAPFSPAVVDEVVARGLLPRLFGERDTTSS